MTFECQQVQITTNCQAIMTSYAYEFSLVKGLGPRGSGRGEMMPVIGYDGGRPTIYLILKLKEEEKCFVKNIFKTNINQHKGFLNINFKI